MPEPVPPTAKKVPKALIHHDDTRIDDYHWLRDRNDPDVLAYLEAENKFTGTVMRSTESLQQQLYEEMLGRIQEDDSEVPYPSGIVPLLQPDGERESLPDTLPASFARHPGTGAA